jgi:hypothetical protein
MWCSGQFMHTKSQMERGAGCDLRLKLSNPTPQQKKMKTKKTTIPSLTNSALGNCRIDPSFNGWFIRKLFLFRVLAVVLMGASLALFLCSAGGVSYGDSATSTPLSVTANAQFYPTFGTPNMR